ncbi:hypothetical protein [uncultured Tateyamaria sp.]|uniref:hypothetical protein n=1 Tax=uncultured Tateyamaria sp. TaxID=455651 RepID=UPI002609AFD4|nr:hypothetical protein [uncultured Tateyamaria sp.]
MRRFAAAAAMAMLTLVPGGPAGAAGFDSDTTCVGRMIFPNSDGSAETYDMELRFDAAGYRIETTSVERQETTTDEGTCTTYLGGICRHDLAVYGERVNDYYEFGLRAMTQSNYAYQETWKDGATGRTILTCQPG